MTRSRQGSGWKTHLEEVISGVSSLLGLGGIDVGGNVAVLLGLLGL